MVAEHVRMGDMDKNGKRIEAMTIPDYGKFLNMMRGLVFDLRSTKKHIVITCHQQSSQDELTKAMRYALALPGQSKDTLAGAFSDVWATMATPMPQNKTKYELRTAPTGFHVSLGASNRAMPAAVDFTNKTPVEIWPILLPLITAK